MEILSYIVEEGLVMIPALYILAEVVKDAKVLKDKWIPLLVLCMSIAGTPLILAGGYTPDNVVQAILIAGATVYSNQVYKQARRDE